MSKHVATTLIADCQAMADLYMDEFNAESVVIPYCWTGLTDLGGAEDRRRMLAEIDLVPREYCVVAGRLNPENNIERIARSYSESDRQETLVVLGAANYDSPTERAIRELVARMTAYGLRATSAAVSCSGRFSLRRLSTSMDTRSGA